MSKNFDVKFKRLLILFVLQQPHNNDVFKECLNTLHICRRTTREEVQTVVFSKMKVRTPLLIVYILVNM